MNSPISGVKCAPEQRLYFSARGNSQSLKEVEAFRHQSSHEQGQFSSGLGAVD